MAKRRQDEYTDVYYGIHIDTCEIKSVWVTRGGKMSCGLSDSHYLMPGRNIRSELIIVYGIADTISFPPSDLEMDYVKRMVGELKLKAEEMKKAKAAQAASKQANRQ